MKERCVLKVEGMVCGACSSRVQTVVKRVDGVGDAAVSHQTGIAEVTYDAMKTNPAAIAKAITENAGFKSEVMK